jgi:hypothetical protein
MERHLPAVVSRVFDQVPEILRSGRPSPDSPVQLEHLRQELEQWAGGLFQARYDDGYLQSRFQLGLELLRTGIDQKHIIAILGIARSLFFDALLREFAASDERLRYAHVLGKAFDLDMVLLCECHARATIENLRRPASKWPG